MPTIASDLLRTRAVRRVGSPGSPEVGRLLVWQCADHVKKVTLELDGNAPFIVLQDADLDIAAA